jgi:hypothetical protein
MRKEDGLAIGLAPVLVEKRRTVSRLENAHDCFSICRDDCCGPIGLKSLALTHFSVQEAHPQHYFRTIRLRAINIHDAAEEINCAQSISGHDFVKSGAQALQPD